MNNHAKLCRELYQHYSENGICVKCGQAWSEAGKTLCRPCAKKIRDREKNKDPTGELKRERMKKLREERRSAGLCIMCGKPTDGIHVQCNKCLEKARERELLRRIKKKVKKGLI